MGIGALEQFFLSTYLAFLLWRGFGPNAGFATWHMFAGVATCDFELFSVNEDGSRDPIDVWAFLPDPHWVINRRELKIVVAYLHHAHGLRLEGSATLHHNGRKTRHRVENSRVVA